MHLILLINSPDNNGWNFSCPNMENCLTIDWVLPKLVVPQKKVLTGFFGGIRVKLYDLLFEN
jgi:hypothetical protein